jgi:hypothetical protein
MTGLDNYWQNQFDGAGVPYHSLLLPFHNGLPFVALPGAARPQPMKVISVYKSLELLPDSYGLNRVQYVSFPNFPYTWIQYDQQSYKALVADAGGDPLGSVMAFAHEWGHHIQNIGERAAYLSPVDLELTRIGCQEPRLPS